MAKRILTLCLALVIGIAFAMPAAAAVKSIKVGGDLTIRGIYRDNLDFSNYDDEDTAESWLTSATRLWVGAELTDNVSVIVRLLNERDWSYEGDDIGFEYLNTDLELDLAYIKLKDLLIPGLSATLGRQEILLGKGFVVGNRQGDGGSAYGAIRAEDLTARKSFDAWRLDYEVGVSPVTVTLFDTKINEDAGDNEDLDLWGLNVGYKNDNLSLEGYILMLAEQTGDYTNLLTYGARIDQNVAAMPGFSYNLEAAFQSGTYEGTEDMAGWAANGDVSYTFQNPMQAKLGAAWFYASGDKNGNEGYFIPLYPDNQSSRVGRITYAALGNDSETNISVPKIYGSLKPSEKHTLSLAWFPNSTIPDTNNSSSSLGNGLNFGYTYQYTEDVSLGLCVDYAQAGKYVSNGDDDDTALEVIGTVAVSF